MQTRLKCKVSMLPTEKATRLQLTNGTFLNLAVSEFIPNNRTTKGQHLYFTSNREIKEGDWFLWGKHNMIVKATKVEATDEICLKIEATTDPSLDLPLIPQSFIIKFVELQGAIDEVEIDMDYVPGFRIEADPMVHGEKVKTRPDGTVIVHKVKDTWTRDEVETLLWECHKYTKNSIQGGSLFNKVDTSDIIKWIEENL